MKNRIQAVVIFVHHYWAVEAVATMAVPNADALRMPLTAEPIAAKVACAHQSLVAPVVASIMTIMKKTNQLMRMIRLY
jgi:hypothetical protein